MDKTPFGKLVQSGRKSCQLSLRELAAELGTNAQKLSRLERGLAEPDANLRERLIARLGIPRCQTWNAPPLPDCGHALDVFRERRTYPIANERTIEARIGAAFAAYRDEMRRLDRRLPAWAPRFLKAVTCDSGLEVLAFYRLLAAQPTPVFPRLVPLGFRCHPITHPDVSLYGRTIIDDRRFPALILDDALFAFQVPVLANNAPYVLDFLVKYQDRWFDLEIDGKGHLTNRDEDRARDLLIPVLRVRESAVVSDDFLTTVGALLRDAHPALRNGAVRL